MLAVKDINVSTVFKLEILIRLEIEERRVCDVE